MTISIHRFTALILAAWLLSAVTTAQAQGDARPPNFVIILLDDSGWADFRPFSQPAYPTPQVEQLAREGCRFNNFYVPQAICSASRAALLTGCYPGRTKVFGAHAPRAWGLDPQYATLGEVLRKRGYATAVFGKWHIGDQPETRPPARGFEESCGLMYSNDMWEFHPENPKFWGQYPLQFWVNGQVTIERLNADHQPLLTTWYTEHAVDFIQRHRAQPFFLYLPHSMPHVPIFCSEKFRGKYATRTIALCLFDMENDPLEITNVLEKFPEEAAKLGALAERHRQKFYPDQR
jgi:arylsulfatase A